MQPWAKSPWSAYPNLLLYSIVQTGHLPKGVFVLLCLLSLKFFLNFDFFLVLVNLSQLTLVKFSRCRGVCISSM